MSCNIFLNDRNNTLYWNYNIVSFEAIYCGGGGGADYFYGKRKITFENQYNFTMFI